MKKFTKSKSMTLLGATLVTLLFASQSAMAVDEEQEKIPAPNTHMTTPHEHKLGNAEDGTDPANDKEAPAQTADGHHDKDTMDDTKQ